MTRRFRSRVSIRSPAKSHSERGVRLIFADDVTLDLAIASLDTWGNVMMAGGYEGDSGPTHLPTRRHSRNLALLESR